MTGRRPRRDGRETFRTHDDVALEIEAPRESVQVMAT